MLMAEGMAVVGLREEELESLPGSDARKVAIARVIWERTTVSMKWLADHLHLRSAANASQQIRRHRLCPPALPKAIRQWMRLSENVAWTPSSCASAPCVANGVLYTVHDKRLWAVQDKGDKKPATSTSDDAGVQ